MRGGKKEREKRRERRGRERERERERQKVSMTIEIVVDKLISFFFPKSTNTVTNRSLWQMVKRKETPR